MKELNELLKQVVLEKAQVKHMLSQYKKIMDLTGLNYEKEVNVLLDRLIILAERESKLTEIIKKSKK